MRNIVHTVHTMQLPWAELKSWRITKVANGNTWYCKIFGLERWRWRLRLQHDRKPEYKTSCFNFFQKLWLNRSSDNVKLHLKMPKSKLISPKVEKNSKLKQNSKVIFFPPISVLWERNNHICTFSHLKDF